MKAIKISTKTHRHLKMMSAKSGEHLYEIVDDLVKRLRDALLAHAIHKDHALKPNTCSGCQYIEEAIERDRKR